jgi:hypothetical protein
MSGVPFFFVLAPWSDFVPTGLHAAAVVVR